MAFMAPHLLNTKASKPLTDNRMRDAEYKNIPVIQNTMKMSIKSVVKLKQDVVKTSFVEYMQPS